MDDELRTDGFEPDVSGQADETAAGGATPPRTIPPMPQRRAGGRPGHAKPIDGTAGFAGARSSLAAERRAAAALPSVGELDRPSRERGANSPARERFADQLPTSRRRLSFGAKLWFAIAFLAPVVIGTIYLFLIAPDQYVTEFRFSVRVPVGQPGTIAQGGASLSALFGGNPTPGTDLLDNFTVADYARSAQAARDLDAKVNLKAMYNKPADPFSRVGDSATQEKLAKFWKSMVFSDYDVTTGLAVVRVKAYSAEDSYAVANALMQLSNDLVNAIGQRSSTDTVQFAQDQVKRASANVAALRSKIALLSRQGGMDSPSVGVLPANSTLATALRTRISQIQAQIQVFEQQFHDPNAPQIVLLRQQLAASQRGLAQAVSVTNAAPTNNFADLTVQLQASLTVLSSAQAALSNAQAMSDAQRLYLTTYVKPIQAESATAPDRWMDLLLVALVAAMVWLIGLLLRNSILEHGR